MAFTLHNSAARSDKVGICVGLGRLWKHKEGVFKTAGPPYMHPKYGRGGGEKKCAQHISDGPGKGGSSQCLPFAALHSLRQVDFGKPAYGWLSKLWSFFGGALNIRGRIFIGSPELTIILTTNHIMQQ